MSSVKLTFSKIASNGSESTILKTIRDHAPISRSGISKCTKLPLPAVSRSVTQLVARDVVIETPLSDTSGPRRKRGISLNPKTGYCLSVQYEASGIAGVVMDASYEIVVRESCCKPLGTFSRDRVIHEINSMIKLLQQKLPSSAGKCLGIALGDPGVIDEHDGKSIMSTTMDDWSDVPIVKIIEEKFGIPVMLLNSSMERIRAVDRLNVGNSTENLVYIEYGDGIGCGLKLCGNYIFGKANLAGEFGHTRATDDPISCRCGAVGCLEAIAAIPALARNAMEAVDENSMSSLADITDIDGYAVLEAAAQGDRLACRIVEEAFSYLARAVGGLINILAPEIVVFDHTMSKAGPDMIAFFTEAVRKSVLPSHLDKLDLRVSKLTADTGAYGGAVAVLDHCLEC